MSCHLNLFPFTFCCLFHQFSRDFEHTPHYYSYRAKRLKEEAAEKKRSEDEKAAAAAAAEV